MDELIVGVSEDDRLHESEKVTDRDSVACWVPDVVSDCSRVMEG